MRVLGVVEHADVDVEAAQRVDERRDRAVAAALDRDRHAGVGQLDHHLVEVLAVRLVAVPGEGEPAPRGDGVGQVLAAERRPHLRRR